GPGTELSAEWRRDAAGGDAPRLGVADALSARAGAHLEQDLGELRGLARPRLAADHDHLVPLEGSADLVAARAHRQRGVEADFSAHELGRIVQGRARESPRRTRPQVARYHQTLRRGFGWTPRRRSATVVPQLAARTAGDQRGKGEAPQRLFRFGGAGAPPFFYARSPAGRAICGASRGRNTSSTSWPESD